MYHYSWLELIPGLQHALEGIHVGGFEVGHNALAIMSAWFVCLLLVALALVARKGLDAAIARQGNERFLADRTLNLRTGFELLTEGLDNLLTSILGKHDARAFFGLLAGLFAYILTGNLMGLLPGMVPPTDNVNTNLAMAAVVMITFNAVGMKRQGVVAYFKHMAGPMLAVAWLLLPIEMLTMFIVRPVSLTLRLTGNIFGDHTVFGIFSGLFYPYVPMSWIFLGLGLMVSVIQALVFTLLTSVYISLAAPHGDHHH